MSERLELGSVAESCRVCVLQDGESRVRLELRAVVDEDSLSTSPGSPPLPPFPSPPILTDTSPVESFLSGKNCLQGVSTSFTSFQVNTQTLKIVILCSTYFYATFYVVFPFI